MSKAGKAHTPPSARKAWAWVGAALPLVKPNVSMKDEWKIISSARIQVLLQLPVEVLMRPHIEDLQQVPFGVELVGKKKLLRADLELDDANTLEDADLGLT